MPNLLSKHVKSRIELHLHLEGSVRLSTIYALAFEKKVCLIPDPQKNDSGPNTYNEIVDFVTITKPVNLAHFIKKIDRYLPLFIGDLEAIERIAWELVEDQSKEQVIYFEARYSPHLMCNTVPTAFNKMTPLKASDPKAVTPRDVIQAVQRGFVRGEKEFGTKVRHILCSIKSTGWTNDVVTMAHENQSFVVGIDIAGNEADCSEEDVAAFQRAKELGIHRTVHAGEDGPAANVKIAVDKLGAERIGHGYRVIEDENIYSECKAKNIHFEVCPYSSYLTNAVAKKAPHPVIRFADDNVNFSINKDDSTVTHSTLDSEYMLLTRMGFNELHFVIANFNAARSCFLPPAEKEELLNQMYKIYRFIQG